MTGYLTIVDTPKCGSYKLKIPNREVLEIYRNQVLEWFNDKMSVESDSLSELYHAFEVCDTEQIETLLYKQLRYTVSFHDAYESFYHGFILALLRNCTSWIVRSNRESGNGRSDITVAKDDKEFGFIVEVKVVKSESALVTACEDALKQIEDRNYADALRGDGIEDITIYGIAFCEKKCVVRARKIGAEGNGDR